MSKPDGLHLQRVEAGHYRTPDGRYSVIRVGSTGEWDEYTECWIVCHGDDQEAEILDRPTKRECVEALARILEKENMS